MWDFIQNVSINKGKHAVKFGYEYRPIKFPFFQVPTLARHFPFPTEPNGNSGSSRAKPATEWRRSCLGYPGNSTHHDHELHLVGEGRARLLLSRMTGRSTSKLTLNIGVRYELFSPISERFGRQSNYVPETATLVIPEGKNQDAPLPPNFATTFPTIKVDRGEVDKYLIPWDKTNWGPRIGIAYQMSYKDGRPRRLRNLLRRRREPGWQPEPRRRRSVQPDAGPEPEQRFRASDIRSSARFSRAGR